jgi:hypothetical protein
VATLLKHAYVATMDDDGTEYADGWILFADGVVPDAACSVVRSPYSPYLPTPSAATRRR